MFAAAATPEWLERARGLARAGRWQEAKYVLLAAGGGVDECPWALYLLAEACSRLSDRVTAFDAARRALSAFRLAGDDAGILKATNLIGIVHFHGGDPASAQAWFRDALELAHAAGASEMAARIANNLGSVHTLQGDAARALEHYHAALAAYDTAGDVAGQAQVCHNLGIAHRDLERWAEADALFAAAATHAQSLGDHSAFGFAILERAGLALRRGEPGVAEQVARQAAVRFDACGSEYGHAEVFRLRGMIAARRGELAEAHALLDRAAARSAIHGVALVDAEVRLERGIVLCRLGERDAGQDDFRVAAETFESLGAAHLARRARGLLAAPPSPDAPSADSRPADSPSAGSPSAEAASAGSAPPESTSAVVPVAAVPVVAGRVGATPSPEVPASVQVAGDGTSRMRAA